MNESPSVSRPRVSKNHGRIESLAARLGSLHNRVVFAGDCALDLLLTHRGVAQLSRPVRPDPTISLVAYGSPDRLRTEFRQLGMQPEAGRQGTDLWRGPDGIRFELIAPEGWIVTNNPWHQYVLECTLQVQSYSGPAYRVAGAPAFMATQLFVPADSRVLPYDGRLEDIVLLAIGRGELSREVAAAPADVREHIAKALQPLLLGGDALAVVNALLPRAVRTPLAARRTLNVLRSVAGLSPLEREPRRRTVSYISEPAPPTPTR